MEPPTCPDPDADLIARVVQGEDGAFDALVRKHQQMIAQLLFRFAGRPADLDDLVQQVFIRAYHALPTWESGRAPFVHWLRRVAVNVGRDHCRARARRPVVEEIGPEEIDSTGGDPAAQAALADVHRLLALLPPDDRALLTLQYLEGLSLAEIADSFSWSVENTKVRSFRARQKLQTILRRHGYTHA